MLKKVLRKKENELSMSTVSFVTNTSTNENHGVVLTATDHAKFVDEFFHVMNATIDFKEFLSAYQNILYHHMFVVTFWRDRGGDADIEELWTDFNNGKERYIAEFLERCYEQGILAQQRETILNYQNELTDGNIQYMENLLSPGIHLSGVEHSKLVGEFLHVISNTYDFQEFLKAYRNMLYHQKQLVMWWRGRGGDADIEELLIDFNNNKGTYINEFLDRCYNAGILNQNKDAILNFPNELTEDNIKHREELLNCSI